MHNTKEIMTALAEYKMRKGIFGKEFVIQNEKTMEATVWWGGLCSTSPLSDLAIDIFQTERTFSM